MATTQSAPRIPGFEVTGLLGQGAMSNVYRGVREGQPFAIKMMRADRRQHDVDAALRFRREAAAIARLDHPGLVKVIEVGEVEGNPFLVMELVEGESLERRLKRGPLSEPELLMVAKSVGMALSEVHRHGLVHRDLKPANIILLPSGNAKVIDFGFVGSVAEGQGGEAEGEIIGTFLYCAPEQSGMLKDRKVDSRADLYALGTILFECATGAPPFQARDLGELLRMHLAVRPPDAHQVNPAVRPTMALILNKLLAKDPDDRYQTATGLLADLENLTELESAQKFGRAVVLGARDAQLHAGFEVPLVGRATEMTALGKHWARSREGQGTMLQVEGEGGSGKTRLVRELIRVARKEGALVLSGKAQQGERTPFGPLREAVDTYLSVLQKLPADQQAPALKNIKEAAGGFGGIVKRLSRSLEALFGEAPDLPPLDPLHEQQRFYDKVSQFLCGIAKGAGPTLLLVDDIQWLDDGSIEVLHRMAQQARGLPLLIMTAARNDPQSEPARKAFVRKMGDALAECFALGPLDGTSVGELVAAHLGGKRLDPSVVEKINSRARGNPFALGEYVHALLEGGMLRPTYGSWVVDASRFHEAAISKDVIQLLINRIKGLSEETRQVLDVAAVIGFEFASSVLTDALGGKADRVRRALEDALRAGLIERVDVSFRFIHDRIHEAILSGLDVARSRDINQSVAEALDKFPDKSGPVLHSLARHYSRGHAEKHQDRIYETSLRAGVNALETFSNSEAVDLLGRAYRAAEILGISGPSKAMISELMGVACTRTGKLDAAATHIRQALTQAKTKEDRSRLHFLLGNAFASKGRLLDGKRELELALKLLGAGVPASNGLKVLSLLWNLLWATIRSRTGLGYGSAKGAERQRRQAISNIQVALRLLGLFLNNPLMLLHMGVRELHNAQFLGTSREAAKAHAFWSLALAVFYAGGASKRHGKIGIAMAQQLGDPETLVYAEVYAVTAQEMAGDFQGGQRGQEQVLPDLLRYGSTWDVSGQITHHATGMSGTGRARDTIDFLLNNLDAVNRSGHESLQANVFALLHSQLTVLGRIPDAVKARDQSKRLADISGALHGKGQYLSHSIFAMYEQAEYGPEFDRLIEEFYKLGLAEYQNRHGYLAACYARLDQLFRAQGREAQKKARQALKRALEKAGFPPPVNKPPIWGTHIQILNAGIARFEKKYRTARQLLEKATALANLCDSLWAKWAIARERARLAQAQGDEAAARRQVDIAINIARREGWQLRVQSVEREFGALARPVAVAPPPGAESVVTGPATAAAGSQWFSSRTGSKVRMIEIERQMETLLQVSLATASSLDPAEQARAALDELVQLLGAERAFLFAVDQERGGLEMQAGRDAEKKDLLALSGFSSTVVNKVWSTGEAVVVSGTDEGEALGSESAVVHNLRSILAAPLLLRDKKLGVVYLDSRMAKGMFGKQHMRILQPICNFIAISLQTGRMARVEATQRALEKDMALTAAVQSLFLPKQGTHRNAAVEVSGFYRPATQCGGDWWWYEPQGEQGMRVYLGDVTGHGAASAMVTASVASAFQFLRRTASTRDAGDLVQELGQHLRATTDGAYYMTLSAVEVDGAAGKLRWWNAGSPPLFVHRLGGNIEVINLPGAPLGSGGAPPGFAETNIAKGERVLIFTDGVSELNLPNKKQLGFKKLSRIFADTRDMPVTEAAAALAGRLDAARQGTPQEDDITFAVVDLLAGK